MEAEMQHELASEVCVVGITDFDATEDLGAPFQVILSNGVTEQKDNNGSVYTTIPDLTGLFKTLVQTRVLHPRKLSGADLKFVRRVVGLQAKTVAKKMDITPEHLSRCEVGTKVLSGASEKIFRMYAFISSLCPDPESIIAMADDPKVQRKTMTKEDSKNIDKLLLSFMSIEIENVFDVDNLLVLHFCLGSVMSDDTEWREAA